MTLKQVFLSCCILAVDKFIPSFISTLRSLSHYHKYHHLFSPLCILFVVLTFARSVVATASRLQTISWKKGCVRGWPEIVILFSLASLSPDDTFNANSVLVMVHLNERITGRTLVACVGWRLKDKLFILSLPFLVFI